jgi:hypothetical protein
MAQPVIQLGRQSKFSNNAKNYPEQDTKRLTHPQLITPQKKRENKWQEAKQSQ